MGKQEHHDTGGLWERQYLYLTTFYQYKHLKRKLIVSESRPSQPEQYTIHIKEQIPAHWSTWFGGLTIAYLESGGTILSGPVVDQSALHGLLAKVRDLNLTLISITRIESHPTKTNPVEEA